MDTYLTIAQHVLRASKRPMTAQAILNAAYRAGIVPHHLHGKTQHKTLQARLSEDILLHRSSSPFFRTEPGHFFLSELIGDPFVPEQYKVPFPARRRTRDLRRDLTLAINLSFLNSRARLPDRGWDDFISEATAEDALHFIMPHDTKPDKAEVWTFTLIRRNTNVLSYRMGRYRDDRDAFANKCSVGFPGVVTSADRTLFSQSDFGVRDNSLSVILADLDLSVNAFKDDYDSIAKPSPLFSILVEGKDASPVLLLLMEWVCPDWFEPVTRRLSINNPHWLDFTVRPNNLDDYEPWSVAAIQSVLQ